MADGQEEKPNMRPHRRRLAVHNYRTTFSSIDDTPRLTDRFSLWRQVAQNIGSDTKVTLFDFGVYQGMSTRFWTENFVNPASRFHGFDSFQGLPEDWAGKMIKGTFDTGGAVPDIPDDRLNFHVGWIQNTLPEFLKDFKKSSAGTVVLHIDIDLYSASLFILTTMWHQLDEAYLVFDEFGVDENLSLGDFASAYPVDIEFYGHTFNENTKLPQQVFAKMVKKPYTVE